jgi:hypothetical protein
VVAFTLLHTGKYTGNFRPKESRTSLAVSALAEQAGQHELGVKWGAFITIESVGCVQWTVEHQLRNARRGTHAVRLRGCLNATRWTLCRCLRHAHAREARGLTYGKAARTKGHPKQCAEAS